MATRRSSAFDEKRARIAALASAPPAVACAELRRFLGDRAAYLVGEAAEAARKLELRELIPDMATAFDRLLVDPVSTDKGCLGKTRILEALLGLEADVPSTYLAGIRHVQREPAFPTAADTAAAVRGLSAHALVQIDHPAVLFELAPLLADPEVLARAEAARALGRSGIQGAAPLLHLRALVGREEPDVLQACYEGMLRLAPARYLSAVGGALRSRDADAAEAAALALGGSRLREALPPLAGALAAASDPRAQNTLLTAVGLHRSDEAHELLLGLVERADEAQAVAALAALSLSRHDARVSERVREAARRRGAKRVTEAWRERFEG